MWKLKCGNTEKTVVKRNILGKNEIRKFFTENEYALGDIEEECIFEMQKGDILKIFFPSHTKYIEVIAL